jgi:hypothetical protein
MTTACVLSPELRATLARPRDLVRDQGETTLDTLPAPLNLT